MIVAQEPLLASQCLLIQGDGAPHVARFLVAPREVMPCGQRGGVIVSQDPLPVGQHPLIQRDRPLHIS